LRFVGDVYRAHNPQWSFAPLSGEGAAIHGGRFNRKGVPALYLAGTVVGAVAEASQGFAHKLEPCVICTYEVDCEDIVDLRDADARGAHDLAEDDLACAWMLMALSGKTPQTWALADRLIENRASGVIAPSYARGAPADAWNLVLWRWTSRRPHRCRVYDPKSRLPKDQASWRA
jgi:RES domain-containing protein